LLVNAGADINSADSQGHTLLHQAAFNDNAVLANLCVLMGADPDLRGLDGKTPRQLGRELGSRKFLKAISVK
jgi:ankyrin repeat protein